MKRHIAVYIFMIMITLCAGTSPVFCIVEDGGFGIDVSVDDVATGSEDAKDSVLTRYNVKLFTDDAEERYSQVKNENEEHEQEQLAAMFDADFSFEKDLDYEKKQMIEDAHLFSGDSMHYGHDTDTKDREGSAFIHMMDMLGNIIKWITVGAITAAVTVFIIRKKRIKNGYYNNYQKQ